MMKINAMIFRIPDNHLFPHSKQFYVIIPNKYTVSVILEGNFSRGEFSLWVSISMHYSNLMSEIKISWLKLEPPS